MATQKCPTNLKRYTPIILSGTPNGSAGTRSIHSTTCTNGYYRDHDDLQEAKCAAEDVIRKNSLQNKGNVEVLIFDRQTMSLASVAMIPSQPMLDWTDNSAPPSPTP